MHPLAAQGFRCAAARRFDGVPPKAVGDEANDGRGRVVQTQTQTQTQVFVDGAIRRGHVSTCLDRGRIAEEEKKGKGAAAALKERLGQHRSRSWMLQQATVNPYEVGTSTYSLPPAL